MSKILILRFPSSDQFLHSARFQTKKCYHGMHFGLRLNEIFDYSTTVSFDPSPLLKYEIMNDTLQKKIFCRGTKNQYILLRFIILRRTLLSRRLFAATTAWMPVISFRWPITIPFVRMRWTTRLPLSSTSNIIISAHEWAWVFRRFHFQQLRCMFVAASMWLVFL